ncbi:MAG TPA: hypothetical protein VFA34_08890 [Actinomycetota bacterium]|nr:hypothetical protein [Actinomycetota bacterium]
MRRRMLWIVGAVLLPLLAVLLLLVFFVLPGGSDSASAAILDRVTQTADNDTAKLLIDREWGDGRLLLASFEKGAESRLALGFAIERGRGWRLAAYTEERAERRDVVVGSLLVASSEGGTGQPPWSAAAGELRGTNIHRVIIRWASGETSSAFAKDNAYLVVQRGTTTPLEARYLAKDGNEIAKVPIG